MICLKVNWLVQRWLVVLFCVATHTVHAQRDGAQPVSGTVGANEVNGISTPKGEKIGYASGFIGAYAVPSVTVAEEVPTPFVAFGFPFPVRYAFDTFDDSNFQISKGYFGDRIQLNWKILANKEDIDGLTLYRRTYQSGAPWEDAEIASLSADALEYRDELISGNVLFEYKLEVVWKNEKRPITEFNGFITGVGFRSPTAMVTGNVSYEGGTPVKDVRLVAQASGASGSVNTAIKIPTTKTALSTTAFNKDLQGNEILVEAWMKLGQALSDNEQRQILKLQSENTADSLAFGLRKINDNEYRVSALKKVGGGPEWTLKGFIPSGGINAKGEDIFVPVGALDQNYNHFAFQLVGSNANLFINGRPMTNAYKERVAELVKAAKGDGVIFDITRNTSSSQVSGLTYNGIQLGDTQGGSDDHVLLDEVRVWSGEEVKKEAGIRRDFKKTISGGERGLFAYYPFTIGIGNIAYDQANEDFIFSQNDIGLGTGVLWTSADVPTQEQFGIMGITDENGNYQITGIPYKGDGESFSITPIFGKHEFRPAQKQLFLGKEEAVVNNLDFTDISSFVFKGKIVHNTRDFFKPVAGTPAVVGNLVPGERYNQYNVDGVIYNMGDYWADENLNDKGQTVLQPYYVVPLPGARIAIDGRLVLDGTGSPVLSDDKGEFEIEVPIGDHYIEVIKQGHTFKHEGRFPAWDNKDEAATLSEFFEDRESQVFFVDNTTVDLVGRVAGGDIQADKPLGFGHQGAYNHIEEEGVDPIPVTGKANLGSALISLGLKGATGTEVIQIRTNGTTGEYRVSVPPLKYEIKKGKAGISLTNQNNSDLVEPFTEDQVELDLTEANTLLKYPEYSISKDGDEYTLVSSKDSEDAPIGGDLTIYTLLDDELDNTETKEVPQELLDKGVGAPYHYDRSFIFYAKPTLTLLDQSKEERVEVAGKEYAVDYKADASIPYVYKLGSNYTVEITLNEIYYNGEGLEEGSEAPLSSMEEKYKDFIGVERGEFLITNNFGEEILSASSGNKGGVFRYNFKAMRANSSGDFLNTLSIQYKENENATPVAIDGLRKNGLVLGVAEATGSSFLTKGPEYPDIILRDPPGSNSYAEITKGSTVSISKSFDFSFDASGSIGLEKNFGTRVTVSGGIVPTPEIETVVENELSFNATVSSGYTDGNTKETTYTFNDTYRTSDDPNFVGADADLFIGMSENLKVTKALGVGAVLGATGRGYGLEFRELKDDEPFGSAVVVTFDQKESLAVENLGETLFVFTQGFILNDLIPQYEGWTNELQIFLDSNPSNIVLTKDDAKDKFPFLPKPQGDEVVNLVNEYQRLLTDVNNWRKILRENEQLKYLALNEPQKLGQNVDENILETVTRVLVEGVEDVLTIGGASRFREKLKDIRNRNFRKNISFDSGAGEITFETEILDIEAEERTLNASMEMETQWVQGGSVNSFGVAGSIGATTSRESLLNSVVTDEQAFNVSYTLNDLDGNNNLTVDVFNLLDGNGPIFVTRAGVTSCPWEGPNLSNFYKKDDSNIQEDIYAGIQVIQQLEEEAGEALATSTVSLESPVLTVDRTEVSGVSQGKKAVFNLKLANASEAKKDVFLQLLVDPATLKGAVTNIPAAGEIIAIPADSVVDYTLTIAQGPEDQFDYEDVDIVLRTPCFFADYAQTKLEDRISVTARFVPACAPVVITEPVENWLKNRENTFLVSEDKVEVLPQKIMIDASAVTQEGTEVLLEYRLKGAATWNRLARWHNSAETFERDRENKNAFMLDEDRMLELNWDVVEDGLLDDDYELRVRSFCTNETTFVSDLVPGRVDLNAPRQFGTPTPTNGILTAGDDLLVSFNEDVRRTGATKLSFQVKLNQLPIDHQVAVGFDPNSSGVIERPNFGSGNMSLQWWMNNQMTEDSFVPLFFQDLTELIVRIRKDKMRVEYRGQALFDSDVAITNGDGYQFYTLAYKESETQGLGSAKTTATLEVYENGSVAASVDLGENLIEWDNETPLQIAPGGGTIQMHDLRIWSKYFSVADANASKGATYTGTERDLLGYWPMNEGNGSLAFDAARAKHLQLNGTTWIIKPSGQAYTFNGANAMRLNQMGSAIIGDNMDATFGLWFKTTGPNGTLMANGAADGSEPEVGNGFRNKFKLSIKDGILNFSAENKDYSFGAVPVNDGKWHQATTVIRRDGNMRMLLDGEEVATHSTAELGGFSNSFMVVGSGLDYATTTEEQVLFGGSYGFTDYFNGSIDDVKIWKLARTNDQIREEMFFELDPFNTPGLIVYGTMNKPTEQSPPNTPPNYFSPNTFEELTAKAAQLVVNGAFYSENAPPLKPYRNIEPIPVDDLIRENQLLLLPNLTNWASVEGKTATITVSGLLDKAGNIQASPITWNVFIDKNPIKWFAEGFDEIVTLKQNFGEESNFEIKISNSGPDPLPYSVQNIPSWLKISPNTGTLAPNSKITLVCSVKPTTKVGRQEHDLFLDAGYGLDDKITLDLRVLEGEPDWEVNPDDFQYSMNIIAKVSVDGILSDDDLDKVAAKVNDELRGVAYMQYDEDFDEHFMYLTIYSNTTNGEPLSFDIWDASQGLIKDALLDGVEEIVFVDNNVKGTQVVPVIISNTQELYQIQSFNEGWNWMSLYVNDPNMTDISSLFRDFVLSNQDKMEFREVTVGTGGGITTGSSFSTYDTSTSALTGWSKILSLPEAHKNMYQVRLGRAQEVTFKGSALDVGDIPLPLASNWNFLPYLGNSVLSVNEALANLDVTNGDLVKSQSTFAIYNELQGWKGNLIVFEPGEGYMLKIGKEQSGFKYPNYSNAAAKQQKGKTVVTNTAVVDEHFANFAMTMNMVASLPEGISVDAIQWKTQEGELRSYTEVDSNKENQHFITIYGDAEQSLICSLLKNGEVMETLNIISFRPNSLVGDLEKSYPIVMAETREEEPALTRNEFIVAPNPFGEELVLFVTTDKETDLAIAIFAMDGRLMAQQRFKLSRGSNELRLRPNLVRGMYLLRANMGADEWNTKIIRE